MNEGYSRPRPVRRDYPPAGPGNWARPAGSFGGRPAPKVRAAPEGSENWPKPWVQLRTFSYAPAIYPAMMGAVSADVKPGALVNVFDKNGRPFGHGLYNPLARVPLRVIHHGDDEFTEESFIKLLDRAVDLRLKMLNVPEHTDAFRVVHSDGDGLSGLVVDKFADVLSVQVHSLGVWQRLPKFLAHLHARLGTQRTVIEVDHPVAKHESIRVGEIQGDDVRTVKILEHGIRYEVDFATGHKTGFFCDQRDNRRGLARWCKDARVLDLCCYSGGFALVAKLVGGAASVTGVDLDEAAIAQAKRNMNLNKARVDWVHCDAFSYARQMRKDGKKFDVVVLDPPKLIDGRDEEVFQDGMLKYEDLNSLGMVITEPGGMLVTCSCSGQLNSGEFEQMAIRSAHRVGRKLQFLDRTGAGADHPVMSNCLESRYLKVLWARVW
jgi:23S rRNA (cytosine1962-C5)-methyltransferase